MIVPTVSWLLLSAASVLGQNEASPATPPADPNTAVSSSPASPPNPETPPFDHLAGPQESFHFLSPSLNYYPPDGTWATSMLNAAANATTEASVSISTLASGFTWSFSRTTVTLLVNGSSPETFNASTTVNENNATVSGLPYGWHNFTLVTNGTGSLNGAQPIQDGSTWLPAKSGQMVTVNGTESNLYSTTGDWTDQGTTNSTGAKLTIRPPKGTALLQLTTDQPSAPFADFNVSFSPAPPLQPANQSFVGTLHSAEIVAAIGILNVVQFQAELDPAVEYTVDVVYVGDGTIPYQVSNIGAYEAQGRADDTTVVGAAAGAAANPENSANSLAAPGLVCAVAALLAVQVAVN